MVDVKHIDEHLDEIGPDSIDGLAVDQIVCADRIVLNKIDLVGDDHIATTEQRIRSLNNEAAVLRSSFARVDLDGILGVGAFARSERSAVGDGFLDDVHVPGRPELESVSVSVVGELDGDRFDEWLGGLVEERSADIYRIKGILAIVGESERVVVQGVHSIVERYPDGSWTGPRVSRLVLIGRDIDQGEIEAALEGCVAE